MFELALAVCLGARGAEGQRVGVAAATEGDAKDERCERRETGRSPGTPAKASEVVLG